jgi:hypothetical protein
VHIGDPDRALALLRSSRNIKDDPNLLAAEIATATLAKRSSRHISAGIGLLASATTPRRDYSELAAAIGTVELIHGASKRAREQFKRSLMAPTENSLAQAQWAHEQDRRIQIPSNAWNTPGSHEANALSLRQTREWSQALDACADWLAEEPFSVRPAFVGSFIGFRPEHNLIAEKFASAGLAADPGSVGLLNNRAVVRVYRGDLDLAMNDIRAATKLERGKSNPALLATLGLLAFRVGFPEIGRQLYQRALSWLYISKERTAVARGFLYLTREEIRADPSRASTYVSVATKIGKAPIVTGQPELIGMADLVQEEWKAAMVVKSAAHGDDEARFPPAEFWHQASLFDVPGEALEQTRLAAEYANLAIAPQERR